MDDADIEELFSGLGAVSIRRMFGGKGVYHQGLIVGVVLRDGEMRLKGDALSGPEFEAAGGRRWTYDGDKGPVAMPYWSIPDDAYDDPEVMARWTRLAFEAALRAPPKPKPSRNAGRRQASASSE
jgi:DNA transformation protein and related proteins